MSEKYISVWIWMINGIIAVATLWFANSFIVNPTSDWTLKINQIPNIKQVNLNTDFKLHKIGDVTPGRTVSDPLWRIIDKFQMNQLELPDEPPEPTKPKVKVETTTEPPTKEDALVDLKKRIKINGVFAPYNADVDIINTGLNVVVIPYTRLNPNIKDDVLLSDQYNIYDDLTEIGLPARCISIETDGVLFDYDFTKGKFTKTFRLFMQMEMISPEIYADYLKLHGKEIENKQPDGSGSISSSSNKNKNHKNHPKDTYIDEKSVYHMGSNDIERLSKSFDSEISSLVLTPVKNRKTGKSEGLMVTREPKEDSLAKKYDVRKGDVIISINNHPIGRISEGRKWVNDHPDESTYVIRFIRNGVEQSRTFKNPNN